ncbi:MAG: hypothetical protein AAGC68_13255, partial [Verrucomicrobiota bacterium]
MSDLPETFEEGLFLVRRGESIPREEVFSSLEKRQFACLRGLFEIEEVMEVRSHLKARVRRENDRPSRGETPQDLRSNYQKLRVGSAAPNASSREFGRFLRTLFNPLWCEDIFGAHDLFRRLAGVRNQLLGRPDDWATDSFEDGFWTAARIHQYPVGGGFMGTHRDEALSDAHDENNLPYLQVLLLLSKKGKDFERGGGYLMHGDERLVLDDYCEMGDVVIYNGSSLHGVADIDPHRPLDLDEVGGRLAAFVSLYRS